MLGGLVPSEAVREGFVSGLSPWGADGDLSLIFLHIGGEEDFFLYPSGFFGRSTENPITLLCF